MLRPIRTSLYYKYVRNSLLLYLQAITQHEHCDIEGEKCDQGRT